ncbi:MAG TPA: hypothetical protein VG796_01200 [Verrucomicrobiales bacterium]|nr:hypothetical protein [Verrucomicrobiales bacterium]
MADQLTKERMEAAVQANSPAAALAELASTLMSEGMPQRVMYQLFDEYRARHESDADPTRYDAVLDTMDIISGWCSGSARLFDTSLSEGA